MHPRNDRGGSAYLGLQREAVECREPPRQAGLAVRVPLTAHGPYPGCQSPVAGHSVKIDNITCTQDEVISVKEELREKFSKFGEIGDVYIPRDRNFAFVRYLEKRDAEDAVDAMDGKDIMGQEISVSLSMQAKKTAEELPDKGRGAGRRSRSRRRRDDSRSESYTPWLSQEFRREISVPAVGLAGRHAQLRENGVGVEGAGEMSREAVAGAGVDSIKRLQWRWPACACPKASGRQPLCGNFQPAKLSPQAIISSNFSFLILVSRLQVEWRCIAPKTELLERESSVRFWITYAIDQLQDFVCHRLCSFRRHEGGPRFSPMRYELHELEKLPEAHGTFSIGCLENGEVITGSKKSVQVWSTPSAGSMSRLAEVEVEATCLVGLGSQTIAAGDAAGRVRVWHLRRRVLKEVVCVHPHSGPVRAVSSGGDILLTASDDGTVKQLDVLADFVPSDFFTVVHLPRSTRENEHPFLPGDGVPASAILARGKNVLVGCVVASSVFLQRMEWRRTRQSEKLPFPAWGAQKWRFGCYRADSKFRVPVRGLDADPEGPGARVLAVGGGRFGIWLDPAQGRQASPDDEAQQPAFTAKCGPSETAVVLLPGQPKDLLQVTRAVTGELNCNCEWTPVSSKFAARSMGQPLENLAQMSHIV
ncbi:SRSF2 [Symbiodinium necroappetens]|uniref:SRSF2 protein n=1 Tax=Symbiodinium necroappetens TaxID=1628268 RepID=A0A812J6K1_9DINO|nr:SRSF2 [Symbiodinium necroappetens]